MERRFMIYRGDHLLGYVGDDDAWPCEPFEPAEAFQQVQSLFSKEHEISMRAAELDRPGSRDQAAAQLIEADKLLEQILAPGVRFHYMDGSPAFDCIGLSIADGRVCWR